MTVYLFDRDKKVRAVIAPNHLTELVHEEAANGLRANIDVSYLPQNGEHIGFRCVDGYFRIFTITQTDVNDQRGVAELTCEDAIVAELKEIVIEELQQLDVDLHTAINAILPAGWWVTGVNPQHLDKSRAYFASAWEMLKTFESLYSVRILQYYQYEAGTISGRVIEVVEDVGVFRGRILESRKDASSVVVSRKGKPITRLYGLGPAQGSTDVQTNLTIADAEWSIDKGNPVNKPKGQCWIEDPEAVAKYGLRTDKVMITGVETAEELIQKAWEHLQTVKEPAVTCSAVVAAMEMMPGQDWKVLRLGDLAAIVLRTGDSVVTRIIDIERDYLRHNLTKVISGDKKDSIRSQVSSLITSATHTFERLTIYQNRFHEDEALIQLNAEFIQLNADAIEANAQQIRLNANELIAQAQQISAKANAVEVEAITVKVDALETEITGLLKVDELAAAIAYLGDLHVGGDLDVPGAATMDSLWVNGVATLEGGIVAGDVDCYNIDAGNIACTGLSIGGSTVYKTSLTVVTGIDVVTNLEGRITAVQPVTTKLYYYT